MAGPACIQWIRDELEAHGVLEELSPPLLDTSSLCAFVTDGRALCLLTNAVLEGEEDELPKKLRRSLKQLSKFHALERVQFFLKWCRARAKLEEHLVFTTVQLLDEVNETAVSETIVALRCKTRPGLKGGSALAQYYFDGGVAGHASPSTIGGPTSSTTSASASTTSSADNANRLSSFLNKFPSSPAAKPPMSHNRTSLTSSVVSSNPSPRDIEEPVPGDGDGAEYSNANNNSDSNQSRLRIPSIFKSQSSATASHASATPRSSVISNASSTASTGNDHNRDSRSRSWSSKLSAFSRSHSSSPGVKTSSSTGDLGSSGTPQSSPPASPHNRVSIPSAFTAPASAPRKSMSRLSAFLSSVDTSAPVTPVNDAFCQKEKVSEAAVETVLKPVGESVVEKGVEGVYEDNQGNADEEEPLVVGEDVRAKEKSVDMDEETGRKRLKKPPLSAKLIAFLQAVEPESVTASKQKVLDEEENDSVAAEAEGSVTADSETSVLNTKTIVRPEDVVAETESEVSNDEVDESRADSESEATAVQEAAVQDTAVEEAIVQEAPAKVSREAQGLSVEESGSGIEETIEKESMELPQDAGIEANAQPVSPDVVHENESLATENEVLTQQLRAAEDEVMRKTEELLALGQEVEQLKAQLAKEQTDSQGMVLAAAKVQEALTADVADARAELATFQQTGAVSTSATKEATGATAQVVELLAKNKTLTTEIVSLREDVQTLEQSVQLARDSEDAARYAAQVAFAARDSADEVNQQLKDQIAQLESL
ncbi:unnamed protein product [Hyaloperonospora brassicae]|uniref:Calponin-homology (CH) domain-containing protein n=1 Tax=Hyaloperonospora brassicae TaxID=162125 RepID=A0AAV0UV68_HYABA|nr:unnamed protein product [Hyaloperonospora brassicae]